MTGGGRGQGETFPSPVIAFEPKSEPFSIAGSRKLEARGPQGAQLGGDLGQLTGDPGQLSGDLGQLSGDPGQLSGDLGQLTGDLGQARACLDPFAFYFQRLCDVWEEEYEERLARYPSHGGGVE